LARRRTIHLGPLPSDLINKTLGTEMDAGDAVLTARAQDHIEQDHPDDFALVMHCIELVIKDPTYIGQSPHHGGEFEMVRYVKMAGSDGTVLAAISLTPNDFGNYNVHSAYTISQARVDRRIARGHLFNTKK
jgi:hypothetical protein